MTKPGPTLLVVDDETSIRTMLSLLFTSLGYRVRGASDGFTALAEIQECVPDVLLSDLNMPGMSGFELLSIVRRVYPGIHVATSGSFCGRNVPGGVAADAFYEKATGLSFLFDAISSWAHTRAAIRRLSDGAMPMWMSPTGRLASGELYVLMGCPRCLRAFPKVLPEVHPECCHTACLYCGTDIWFAIAPFADSSIGVSPQDAVSSGHIPVGTPAQGLSGLSVSISAPFPT
jgi:CheY-like chemotaxis protein